MIKKLSKEHEMMKKQDLLHNDSQDLYVFNDGDDLLLVKTPN